MNDNKPPIAEKHELEELLTPEEVSKKLKVKLSTIYHWAQCRTIPFIKIGKHLRFRVRDIARWIEKNRTAKYRLH